MDLVDLGLNLVRGSGVDLGWDLVSGSGVKP